MGTKTNGSTNGNDRIQEKFSRPEHLGNNDRWIAIQHYETENWHDLVKLWRYANLHIIHVIENMDRSKLDHQWITAIETRVTMREMVVDYLPHFQLHLLEIEDLINLK